ncbi:BgTH12-06068 [Blumeria graminis f. sp. triticale]|uniref:BgTH12-06068 n=1 Tax=Blumeria graminis f. sp. triticale TaxID=1689686 RepID=A0A9W4GG85_BLUGR|nr:BgTH12-06068 [Blumeria graminis f. sp. triticale]
MRSTTSITEGSLFPSFLQLCTVLRYQKLDLWPN